MDALARTIREAPCPYQKLGLEFGASVEAIDRAYKLRSKLVHPDKWRDGSSKLATDTFICLRGAYDAAICHSKHYKLDQQQPQPGSAAVKNKWASYAEDSYSNDAPAIVQNSYWAAPGLAQVLIGYFLCAMCSTNLDVQKAMQLSVSLDSCLPIQKGTTCQAKLHTLPIPLCILVHAHIRICSFLPTRASAHTHMYI